MTRHESIQTECEMRIGRQAASYTQGKTNFGIFAVAVDGGQANVVDFGEHTTRGTR